MILDLREPNQALKSGWRDCYELYAEFYKRPMNDEIANQVWSWLLDPNHPVQGRLAIAEGRVVGLMHFRAMPRPLMGTEIGFLDDLFIKSDARGAGLGDAMLQALQGIAAEQGWSVVRWLTADDNYRARGLYDRLAQKTSWNLYEMKAV